MIKPLVEKAVEIRQGQINRAANRIQDEWLDGEREELVAEICEYIKEQTVD